MIKLGGNFSLPAKALLGWVSTFYNKVLNTEGGEMLLHSGNGFMSLSLEMATGLWLKGANPLSMETPLAEQVSVHQSADVP